MNMPKISGRVLSGIQPTGNLHLGNYLGAIQNWTKMQHDMESLYCIVDLHAITMWQEPAALRSGIRDMAAALLACGIDPAKAILFNQSMVREHAELAWVLNCTARMGWLNRMTQFKDKAGKDKEGASVGLFSYPVLQAADILVYKASHVPVGEDQKQHLELARDIAQKFNTDFGVELFSLPEPIIPSATARIMSLRDGTNKMSKSDASDMSRINLTDDADLIVSKIKKAKTDADVLPDNAKALAGRPEAENLVGIFAAMSNQTVDAVLGQFSGKGFGAFKPVLAELLVEKLAPITADYRKLKDDYAHIDAVLRDGAARATAIAAPVLQQVYDVVGFLRV
jgi:tryptophanyl-tRNA synthetase